MLTLIINKIFNNILKKYLTHIYKYFHLHILRLWLPPLAATTTAWSLLPLFNVNLKNE